MRTIESIDAQIKEIRKIVFDTQKTTPKQKKEVEYLLQVKSYLETKPSEDFINSEIVRLEKLIKKRSSTEYFNMWCIGDRAQLKNPKKSFEDEMDIPHFELQLKTLRFILE